MPTHTTEDKKPHENPKKSTEVKKSGLSSNLIVIFMIIFLILGGLAYGMYMVGQRVKEKMGLSGVKMSPDGKSFNIKSTKGELDMQVGDNVQLPADFPKDMPIYPQGKLQSAISTKEGMSITYTVPNVTAGVLQKWYKEELAENGWVNEMDETGGAIISVKKGVYNGIIAIVMQDSNGHVTINIGTKN